MAKAKREGFRPQPVDRTNTIDLPTGDFPDKVTVDLDATDGNAFTVVEVDDTPEKDRGRPNAKYYTAEDEEGDLSAISASEAEKRIKRLKFETNSARREAEAAQRERDAAIEASRVRDAELADLRKRLEGSTGALAASMKSDREARLADARARLERAHAEGDSAAVASATADMGMVQAELVQIASRTPVARAAEAAPVPAAQPATTSRLHPNAQSWIDRHPEFHTDPAFNARAMSVHYALAAENIGPSSPKYAEELDRRLKTGYVEPATGDGSSDGGTPTPRRTNVVAEGSRDTGKVPNPRIVELTKSQLAIAKQLNITPQQYAASLAKYAPAQRNGA